MLRHLTEDEVCFIIEVQPEDIGIEGNASAVDEETDAATVRWIREQLAAGNVWAWATVIVTARWNGMHGTDVLGGCSYESEEAFVRSGGYYDDMRRNALAQLQAELARMAAVLATLQV